MSDKANNGNKPGLPSKSKKPNLSISSSISTGSFKQPLEFKKNRGWSSSESEGEKESKNGAQKKQRKIKKSKTDSQKSRSNESLRSPGDEADTESDFGGGLVPRKIHHPKDNSASHSASTSRRGPAPNMDLRKMLITDRGIDTGAVSTLANEQLQKQLERARIKSGTSSSYGTPSTPSDTNASNENTIQGPIEENDVTNQPPNQPSPNQLAAQVEITQDEPSHHPQSTPDTRGSPNEPSSNQSAAQVEITQDEPSQQPQSTPDTTSPDELTDRNFLDKAKRVVPPQNEDEREIVPRPKSTSKNKKRLHKKTPQSMNIIREIRRLQNSTNLLIPKAPFQRLVREIMAGYAPYGIRMQGKALLAIQETAEDFLIDVFEDTVLLVHHRGRVTINNRDYDMAMRLRERHEHRYRI